MWIFKKQELLRFQSNIIDESINIGWWNGSLTITVKEGANVPGKSL